jgi:hypothetical protein
VGENGFRFKPRDWDYKRTDGKKVYGIMLVYVSLKSQRVGNEHATIPY